MRTVEAIADFWSKGEVGTIVGLGMATAPMLVRAARAAPAPNSANHVATIPENPYHYS